MYYLELMDSKGNWSSEIGDYNHFETLEEIAEVIDDFEDEVMRRSDIDTFSWRILKEENGKMLLQDSFKNWYVDGVLVRDDYADCRSFLEFEEV